MAAAPRAAQVSAGARTSSRRRFGVCPAGEGEGSAGTPCPAAPYHPCALVSLLRAPPSVCRSSAQLSLPRYPADVPRCFAPPRARRPLLHTRPGGSWKRCPFALPPAAPVPAGAHAALLASPRQPRSPAVVGRRPGAGRPAAGSGVPAHLPSAVTGRGRSQAPLLVSRAAALSSESRGAWVGAARPAGETRDAVLRRPASEEGEGGMPARRGTSPLDRGLGRKSVLRKVRVDGVFRNFYLQSYTWEPYFCYRFSLVLQRCTCLDL